MIVTSVCRLCMSEKELRGVFEEEINSGSDMKTIIFITTGVEILQNDVISQKICSNCFKLTSKMFEFRERAVKTDKYLKDQCKNVIQNQEVPSINHVSVILTKSNDHTDNISPVNKENKIPNKAETIRHDPSMIDPEKTKPEETMSTDSSPEFLKKAKKRVHKSIEDIFVKHSEIKLPSSCLRLDVNPSVTLEMDYVEEYFRRNKQDMNKYIQSALRSNRASKKTLQSKQKKTIKVTKISEENTPDTINHPGQLKVGPMSIQLPTRRSLQCKEDEHNDIVKPKSFKRRRISDSSTEPEPMKPPTLMETLQLKPNDNVHRCSICNCPQLSAKALKLHYLTHLKCTYCKKRFKVMNRKEVHDKKCQIKFCLTRSVQVMLDKIDVTKYLTDLSENTETSEGEFQKKTDASSIQANAEIIELSDDDNDPPPPPVAATPKNTNLPVALEAPLHNDLPKLTHLAQPLNTTTPYIEQPLCTGTSIVKPSIHIKDNSVLNTIDTSGPDLKVLKQLLSPSTLSNLKLLVEDETQTNTPSNDEIRYANQVANFKNLFSQLYAYKIPINVKKGDFKVSYEKNQKRAPKPNNPRAYWNVIKPIDIRSTNNTFFTNENFNYHISQGIPLFSQKKQNTSQPIILNHTVLTPNMSQLATNINTIQPVQNSNFKNIQQPASNQISQAQSFPQTVHNQVNSLSQLETSNNQTHSLPQLVQTETSDSQALSFTQQIQTSNNQARILPQLVQTQTSDYQRHILPRQVQSHTSNNQTRNLTQQVQTSNNQTRSLTQQVQTSNQVHSLPQLVQTRTSNVQTHNLPQQVQTSSNTSISLSRQIQSNVQSLTVPQQMPTISVQSHVVPQQMPTISVQSHVVSQQMPTISVQSHVLPQNVQFQIQNVSHSASMNNSVFTLNSNLQNIQQTPVYTADVQNLTNSYFLQANNNTLIIPDTNSTSSLNSTITSSVQGPINTNVNTLSRSHNQSNQRNIRVLTTNHNSTILNPPVPSTSTAASTSSSHLLVRKSPTPTKSNFVANTSYSSGVRKAQLLHVDPFNKTRTVANTSTESRGKSTINNVDSNTDVHRPIIRVRNIFELT